MVNKKINKKSQVFILSFLFLSIIFIVSYYLETPNFYILSKSNYNIMNNIKYEVCKTARLSNGTYIDSRFTDLENKVPQYCKENNYICNLTITKDSNAPTNLNNLNYTYYNYSINISKFMNQSINIYEKFNCN